MTIISQLCQELKKEIELQYRHTDVFLQTITLRAIEKEQEIQSQKVSQLLDQVMKEKDEKCKTNTN